MELNAAVKSGCRIRHRDWPPYHYAELRPTQSGDMRLCRVTPEGEAVPLDLSTMSLNDDLNWKILDLTRE